MQVARVLQSFGITGEVVELKGGYSKEKVYLIQRGTEKYILKGGTGKKNFAHSVLTLLQQKHYSLTPKLCSISGSTETILFDGELYWEVNSFIVGYPTTIPITLHLAYEIGKAVGQFHYCLSAYLPDKDTLVDNHLDYIVSKERRLGWWNSLSQSEKALLKDWGVYEKATTYMKLIEGIYKKVFDLQDFSKMEEELPKSVIHSDLYSQNIFSLDNKVTGIIDFDLMRYGCRIDDIYRIITEFSEYDSGKVLNLLKGYTSILRLSRSEKEYMRIFLYIRYLRGGFYMLGKALELRNDLSNYPESLDQRLDNCITGISKLNAFDIEDILNHI